MTGPFGVAQAMRRELVGKHFVNAPYQWGTVHAVNSNPTSVDLYLDGSSTVTPSIRCLDGYSPAVGDVVLVGRYRSDRWVFGSLSSAPPFVQSGDYTPTVAASTTNPSGYTATGHYIRIGNLVWCWFLITLGSSVGSGYYLVSLPATPAAAIENQGLSASGPGVVSTSGFTAVQGLWSVYSGTSLIMRVPTSSTAIADVTSTVPFTLASGSTLSGQVMYEAS